MVNPRLDVTSWPPTVNRHLGNYDPLLPSRYAPYNVQ